MRTALLTVVQVVGAYDIGGDSFPAPRVTSPEKVCNYCNELPCNISMRERCPFFLPAPVVLC